MAVGGITHTLRSTLVVERRVVKRALNGTRYGNSGSPRLVNRYSSYLRQLVNYLIGVAGWREDSSDSVDDSVTDWSQLSTPGWPKWWEAGTVPIPKSFG